MFKTKITLYKILKKEELFYGLLILAAIFFFDYECLVKSIFHIPCPGCGLTRAFLELLHFNIIGSLSYNILAIPLILYFIGLFGSRIVDAIQGTTTSKEWENPQLSTSQILIIVLVTLSNWGLNIVRGL